ncbi:hypothetical protein PybrP1_002887 [[Pythium] brassicae (nom. inval.)]|nr:hypothetical protein PybrP1_002887 [[Pythium] brassicae (nom. inval.)]
MVSLRLASAAALVGTAIVVGTAASASLPRIDAGVYRALRAAGTVDLIVTMKQSMSPALLAQESAFGSRGDKIADLVARLEKHADVTQAPLRAVFAHESLDSAVSGAADPVSPEPSSPAPSRSPAPTVTTPAPITPSPTTPTPAPITPSPTAPTACTELGFYEVRLRLAVGIVRGQALADTSPSIERVPRWRDGLVAVESNPQSEERETKAECEMREGVPVLSKLIAHLRQSHGFLAKNHTTSQADQVLSL